MRKGRKQAKDTHMKKDVKLIVSRLNSIVVSFFYYAQENVIDNKVAQLQNGHSGCIKIQ